MARKRQIDPDIWTDEELVTLPIEARYLYLGLKSNADDEGRMKASPIHLKLVIFPNDSYSHDQVREWRDLIAHTQSSKIVIYSNGNSPTEYLVLPDWKRDQYINRRSPSKLPPPPPDMIPPQYRADWGIQISDTAHVALTDISRNTHSDNAEASHPIGIGNRESVSGIGNRYRESDMESVSESVIEGPGVIHKVINEFVDNSPRPTDPTLSEPTPDQDKDHDELETIEDYIRRLYKEFFGELEVTPKTIPKIEAAITGISQFSDDDIWLAFEKVSKQRSPPKYPLAYVLKTLRSK